MIEEVESTDGELITEFEVSSHEYDHGPDHMLAENRNRLKDSRHAIHCQFDGLRAQIAALLASSKLDKERIAALEGALVKYGSHIRGPGAMCELLKHSVYPCTCGLEAALSTPAVAPTTDGGAK